MKKNQFFILTAIIFLFNCQIQAQVALPYYSGFDDVNQQDGWEEYKIAAKEFSHWSYSSFNAFSAPNHVGHSYSPSTGITLTDNWFVSPGFNLTNGGMLDSVRYKFMGFSVPEDEDTIAIYLLNGSQDPSMATSKRLLFDFRGDDYQIDDVYRLKSNITLPPQSGLSYFAIRYRNTDCSSKWLAVHFDNVAISGEPVSINQHEENSELSVYPNPSIDGKFYINTLGKPNSIRVLNSLGQAVQNISVIDNSLNSVEIDLTNQIKGIYIIEVSSNGISYTKKVVYQ